MITIHDWFTLFDSMTCMQLFCVWLLTFVSLEVNQFITRVHSLPLLFIQLFCLEWYSFGIHARLINCHDCFILLVETRFRDLEGCYGLYRTFLISNLTPEPDPVFRKITFSKIRSCTLGFLSYFVYPFKNKTKISGDSKSFS